MTRPAIIIGLGGSGQWILTYLKKDLLEIGEGKMPDGVKLLCFDTTLKPTAQAGKLDDQERATETEVKLGSVRLEPETEFIPVGDNTLDLARAIRDGQEGNTPQVHPHIASWFDAKDMLARHKAVTFNTIMGAGQIRDFGRLTIFNDLLKGPKSKIRSHIQMAIRKLHKEVDSNRQLEVIIVASFAGGTGAGMFIDMGILARAEAARTVEKNLCVRGFYILPRVFEVQNKEMQARAFAAWRELDRFLMIGGKYGQRKIYYSATDLDLQIPIDQHIFDVCYLVDAVSDGKNSMDKMPASEGLFPMVSDVISTIMDSKAGQSYTEYITTNLAGKLQQLPRAPYHSAIGAYTIKVPVYFDLQVYAHNFGRDILNKFLRPIRDVEGKKVIGVANDANQEDPNGTGAQGGVKFLLSKSTADYGIVGNEKFNTMFTHVVADHHTKGSVNDVGLIQRVAMMNLAANRSGESNIYLGSLVNISEDITGQKLRKEVDTELLLPITKEVPTSRMAKDTPDLAYARIEKKVPIFINMHYGQRMSDGTERRGSYGDALYKCEQYQVERYRDLLYLWLNATMNGTVEEAERAKGGKLGYVREALEEQVKAFGNFTEFFNKVRAERTERLQKLNLETMTANALAKYRRHKADKCAFTPHDSFIHPRAHINQVDYLKAEQVRIDHRKYDILINILIETADSMKEIASRALAQIDNWIDYLATGDPERQVVSLYNHLESSLDLANANHYLDQRLEKVQRLMGEKPYQLNEEKVKEVLGRLNWKVDIKDSLPQVGLEVKIPQPDGKMIASDFRCAGENVTEYNLGVLLSLGEKIYADLPKQEPVIKLLMNAYPDPNSLADDVDKRAEPLYEKSALNQSPQLVSCYIRLDTMCLDQGRDQADKYVDSFTNRLMALNPIAVESKYQNLPSDNKYRMTIMRSDDLLKSEGFNMWKICYDAYMQYVVSQHIPAERFQVYPAEKNAAFFEQEIYYELKLDNKYRILHPSVVALLEDRSAIEYFFLCFAHGFIQKERMKDGQEVYTFSLPKQKGTIHLSMIFEDTQLYKQPDLLDVIDVFVNKGTDVKNPHLFIDLDEVKKAVRGHMNEIGRDGAVRAFKYQMEDPTGIVKVLEKKVEDERKKVTPAQKEFTAVEYDDLAKIASVIYKRASKLYGDEDN